MQELHDTSFVRTLSNMTAALLREVVPDPAPRFGESTRPLTEQEEYLRLCLLSTGEVIVACDQLHYALAYLSGYRARQTLEGELISRADYIAYQLENLYLRMGMITDRSLKLTNTVFRLGVPPRECRFHVVADNEHVRHTPVRARLRAIGKVVEPYREVRNTIAHLERYSDAKLAEIEGYFILEKSNEPIDPVVEQFRHFYKKEADRYVEARRDELVPVVAALIQAVAKLFDALLPSFEQNHGRLGEGRPTGNLGDATHNSSLPVPARQTGRSRLK